MKQSYPFKTNGRQPSENARRLPMEEHSRTITSDGMVVKFMMDNSVEVCNEAGFACIYTVCDPNLNCRCNYKCLIFLTGFVPRWKSEQIE